MLKKTVLAGGCFWGMEDLIRKQIGVINTEVVYAGGVGDNPTYENHTDYTESVLIEYDNTQTSFKNLLDFFFQIHDPSTYNRQGNDIGTSYKSIIFYNNENEMNESKEFIDIVNKSKRWSGPVMTELKKLDIEKVYKAEEYHQDYLIKVPRGYTCHYVREGGSYLK